MTSEESTVKLTEATTQLSLKDNTATTTTQPLSGVESTLTDHTSQDSEGDNEDDSLARSTEDEVGQLLRATVEELESALQVHVPLSSVHPLSTLTYLSSCFPISSSSFHLPPSQGVKKDACRSRRRTSKTPFRARPLQATGS